MSSFCVLGCFVLNTLSSKAKQLRNVLGRVQGRNRLRNRIEARTQYLPLLWPVRQSGTALEPNDVILANLMTSQTSILFLSLFLPWTRPRTQN